MQTGVIRNFPRPFSFSREVGGIYVLMSTRKKFAVPSHYFFDWNALEIQEN